MLRTRAVLLGGAALSAMLCAAAPAVISGGGPALAAAKAASVKIDNFNFTPPTLVVEPGTTVTWTNADDSPHSVHEMDGRFKSAALDTDDRFSQTFSAPGQYQYFCSIHPRMVGKIIVQPAGKTSSN